MPSDVIVKFRGDDKDLTEATKRSKEGIRDFANDANLHMTSAAMSFLKAAAAATAIGTALAGAATYVSKLALTQVTAENKLAAVLRATGHAAGWQHGQLLKLASALQDVTTYGDETTIAGMALLATFREVKGEAFEETIRLAMDLSDVFGGDLNSNILMMGKALNEPLVGLTALSRRGVTFSQIQKDQIRQFVEANDVMGAQGVILKEVRNQVGGVAEEVAASTGAFQQMLNTIGDLGETIGKRLLPTLIPLAKTIKIMTQTIKAETVLSLVKWGSALAAIVFVIPSMVAGIFSLIAAFKALNAAQIITLSLTGPAGWAVLVAGAAAAAVALVGVAKAYGEISDAAHKAHTQAMTEMDEMNKKRDDLAESMRAGVGVVPKVPEEEAKLPTRDEQIAAIKEEARKEVFEGEQFKHFVEGTKEAREFSEDKGHQERTEERVSGAIDYFLDQEKKLVAERTKALDEAIAEEQEKALALKLHKEAIAGVTGMLGKAGKAVSELTGKAQKAASALGEGSDSFAAEVGKEFRRRKEEARREKVKEKVDEMLGGPSIDPAIVLGGVFGPGGVVGRIADEAKDKGEAPRIAIESAAQVYRRISMAAANRGSPEVRSADANEKTAKNTEKTNLIMADFAANLDPLNAPIELRTSVVIK